MQNIRPLPLTVGARLRQPNHYDPTVRRVNVARIVCGVAFVLPGACHGYSRNFWPWSLQTASLCALTQVFAPLLIRTGPGLRQHTQALDNALRANSHSLQLLCNPP